MARRWESSGKALKAHGRVSCPGGLCVAAVLNPSIYMDSGDMARRWEGSGKALKAHGRDSYPGGLCFAAVLKPSKWTIWRHGQALGKQWQSAKGPRKGFVSWWTVLRM